jgi:hypothetical protein
MWKKWECFVSNYQAPTPFKFSDVFVPTIDTVRNNYIITKMISIQKSTLLVGHSGTAKTLNIKNYLNELDKEQFSKLNINFSSTTTSLNVQSSIMVIKKKTIFFETFVNFIPPPPEFKSIYLSVKFSYPLAFLHHRLRDPSVKGSKQFEGGGIKLTSTAKKT